MNCVFVQIRCKPGKIFQVAEEITLKEIQSELYSTSGTFDLLLKLYIPTDEDVGEFINGLAKCEETDLTPECITYCKNVLTDQQSPQS